MKNVLKNTCLDLSNITEARLADVFFFALKNAKPEVQEIVLNYLDEINSEVKSLLKKIK